MKIFLEWAFSFFFRICVAFPYVLNTWEREKSIKLSAISQTPLFRVFLVDINPNFWQNSLAYRYINSYWNLLNELYWKSYVKGLLCLWSMYRYLRKLSNLTASSDTADCLLLLWQHGIWDKIRTEGQVVYIYICLLYTSPSPRDA